MKRKGLFYLAIIMMATFFLTLDGQARTRHRYESLDQEFSATYQKVMEMNRGRFADLNKVQVGDVILFPSYWDEDDTEMREVGGPDINGKHDCIWRMVHREVYGEPEEPITYHRAISPQENTSKEEPLLNSLPDSSNEKSQSKNLWWLAILPVIPITMGGRKWWQKKHDPNSYPPVGKNLETLENAEVIAEIQRVYEKNGDKVLEIQGGTLWRSFGPDRITVKMEFGDNKDRNVWLYPGEGVCKIQVQKPWGAKTWKYCRSACTNGMIFQEFELPNGWEFVQNKKALTPTIPEPLISNETLIPETPVSENNTTPAIMVVKFKRPARCQKNLKRCRACQFKRQTKNFCCFKPKQLKTLTA